MKDNSRIKDVFILVPLFNEELVLKQVIVELLNCFKNVIVVNDGSTDNSSDILYGLDVILIEHSQNLGQGAAIRTGFQFIRKYTDAKAVITFDADGQHSVDDAVKFAKSISSSNDMIIFGSRFLGSTSGMPVFKKVILKLAIFFTRRLTGLKLTDTHNGLKAFNRSTLKYFVFNTDNYAFESELIRIVHKYNLSFSELPSHVRYTEYSINNGQKLSNAFIILEDIIKTWRIR